MEYRPRLIPVAVASIALLLMAAGIPAVIAYLEQFAATKGTGDRSNVFWHLPLLFLGIACVFLGAALAWAAIAALRGHSFSQRICRIAVIAVPALGGILAGMLWHGAHRAQVQRAESQQRQAVIDELIAQRHRISLFRVEPRDDGLWWRIRTSGGRAGRYLLRLRAETHGGVLYQHTRRVELDGAARAFEHELSYKQLFSRCFEGRDADAFYVCVPNAGTSNSRLELITVLRLEEAGGERGADVASSLRALASESVRTAVVDTYTVTGEVRVQKLEIQ